MIALLPTTLVLELHGSEKCVQSMVIDIKIIRVICKVKQMKPIGLVPNPEFMSFNTKSPKFS